TAASRTGDEPAGYAAADVSRDPGRRNRQTRPQEGRFRYSRGQGRDNCDRQAEAWSPCVVGEACIGKKNGTGESCIGQGKGRRAGCRRFSQTGWQEGRRPEG